MYMIMCIDHVYVLLHMYMYTVHCTLQVSSIQQEFESIKSRGIHHPNLVQYLAMNHTYHDDDNKISVEVMAKLQLVIVKIASALLFVLAPGTPPYKCKISICEPDARLTYYTLISSWTFFSLPPLISCTWSM